MIGSRLHGPLDLEDRVLIEEPDNGPKSRDPLPILTAAIGELSSADIRTLLARTQRAGDGRATELRPRLREAVCKGELAPEELLRRLDEPALEALAAFSEVALPSPSRRADAVSLLVARARVELDAYALAPSRRRRRRRRAQPDSDRRAPTGELERLRDDVDRLLDERAKLHAKNAALARDLERARDQAASLHAAPGLERVPEDLGELLRSIGIDDRETYKRLYRPAAKLLHPDQNAEGEAAFRLLTRIKDLLEGR